MSSYYQMVQAITSRYSDRIKGVTNDFCDYFHINQLWHNRVDNRGSLESISNHPAWTEYFASQKIYEKCPLLRHSKYVDEGITVLSDEEAEKCMSREIIDTFYDGKIRYNSNTWITMVKKTKTGTDQFGFFIDKKYLPLFINEISLVHLFTGKFRERLHSVFLKMADHKANLIDLMGSHFYKDRKEETFQSELKQQLLKQLGVNESVSLTEREKKVLKFVLQGYSASAIAPQIFLAKRTVEHMLERIKEKLNCNTKTILIQKARELESLGLLNE